MESLNRKPESGIEQEKEPKMFDAVIVLSKIPDFDKSEGVIKLSFDGKMRAIAAGEMYKEGLTGRLIISGGKTFGEEFPSEAQIIADYLTKHFTIPEEAIIKEEASIDTAENIKYIKELLKVQNINGQLAIITNTYHMKRVQKILENKGIKASPVTAEETLVKRSSHYKPLVEKYLTSGSMKTKEIKEAVLRGLLIVDPQSKIHNIITRRIRK